MAVSDQATNLRRRLEMSKHPKQAKTVSIISGKGGVGKSNFAINFSLELINNRKKVLLFDLDVGMGNIDILLGVHAKKTIIDMFTDHLSVHDIVELGPGSLSYIAGGSGLNSFFTLDSEKQNFFFQQYKELVQTYDYIIFDMGAGATKDSLFFILASDECIVVTTPEPTSITDAYGMIKHVIHNQPDMPLYVIMNRSLSLKDGRKSLDRFKLVISQFLQVDIHNMGILPDDQTVLKAVRRQIPYVLLNEKSAISKAMKHLTYNYLFSMSKGMNNHRPASFVQKLKHLMTER